MTKMFFGISVGYIWSHVALTLWIISARAELGEFVEYDLDIEDEEWLQEFNSDGKKLTHEKYCDFKPFLCTHKHILFYINVEIEGCYFHYPWIVHGL